MRIAIGSDHAGFDYKEQVKVLLKELGHEIRDFGTFSSEPVDYPVFIRPVAEAVDVATHDDRPLHEELVVVAPGLTEMRVLQPEALEF